MGQLSIPQLFAIWVLPVLFAITVHEVAHGWVANKLGDPTARMLGRLTLNPIKHIDPLGTIIVPAILLFLGGFIFGWAKPVPVNWHNLKRPKRDMALVALAGPMANLSMIFIWAGIAKLGMLFMPTTQAKLALLYMGQAGIMINSVLMVLNLLPLPPLDGSRVAAAFMPAKMEIAYLRLEPYGFFILLGLLAIGLLKYVLAPPVFMIFNLIARLFGL